MSKRLTWCPQVQIACREIIEHPNVKRRERGATKSIMKYGAEHGSITPGQAKLLGGVYKKVVNNGRYVKHDWWKDET